MPSPQLNRIGKGQLLSPLTHIYIAAHSSNGGNRLELPQSLLAPHITGVDDVIARLEEIDDLRPHQAVSI